MMAKTWYPVIDYLACTECGTCVSICPHGVYDQMKAPVPVVKKPEACADHCHGCGNLCAAGAITYVGDDTGWVPLCGDEQPEEARCSCECEADGCAEGGAGQEQAAGCSCGCDSVPEKKAVVEYLYLDLQRCDRCIGTVIVLDEVM